MNLHKPHYQWKEIFTMSKELTETNQGAIPDWMRKASAGASFGNIDGSDLKPPRLKLLAGQSPEIMDGMPSAAVGQFWITILNINLGPSIQGSPICLRKSYQLWGPRIAGSEKQGPLASASDGIHWDKGSENQKFEVRFPASQGGGTYVWETKRSVAESGLNKFGSSQPGLLLPGGKKSKPAATLTYDVLWVIDMPSGKKQLCVFTNARTGVGPTQKFISTVEAIREEKGIDQFYQRYRIVAQKKSNTETGDSYFTYEYYYLDEFMSENEGKKMRALYDQYTKIGFVSDFDREAEDIGTERRTDSNRTNDDDEIPF